MKKVISAIHWIQSFCFILFPVACTSSISLTQISGYLGCLLWLVYICLTKSRKGVNLSLFWPFSIFLFSSFVAVIFALDPSLSFSHLKKFFNIGVFFWAMNGLVSIGSNKFIALIKSTLKRVDLKITDLDKNSSDNVSKHINFISTMIIISGVLFACYSINQGIIHGIGGFKRNYVHGTLADVMVFSQILVIVALFAMAKFLFSDKHGILEFISVAILTVCIVLTYTRMAWISYLICTCILFYLKSPRLTFVPLLVGFFILAFGPDSVLDRAASTFDFHSGSASQRLLMWQAGWEVFKDYPVTGVGFRGLSLIYGQYPEHSILNTFNYGLHNNFAQIAVDMGLLGLLSWMGIWISYYSHLSRNYRLPQPQNASHWVHIGGGIVVLSFLITGIFDGNFYDSEVVLLVYFIMGLSLINPNKVKE